MKEVLSENNIKYMYMDVCESVGKLKQFLTIRDTDQAFEEVRKEHRVGIPCLVIDDDVILVRGADHARELVEKYQLKG